MSVEIGGDLIPVAAMLVPVVGSIALFSFLGVAAWSDARRKEREAYYNSETLRKIAESSGEGAKAAMDMLHERERNELRRRREGLRLGGLVTAAVGIGVMVLLKAIVHDEPGVYLVGLIPLLVGLALLIYSYVLAPKDSESRVVGERSS
jgi:peptidoglycan/LPS O-acetylase OafA/YrhL